MIRSFLPLLVAVLGVSAHAADFNNPPPASPIMDPAKEGQELAAKLRSFAPVQNSEFSGTLEITPRDGRPQFIPITSRLVLGPTNWQVFYHSAPTNGATAETLVITRGPNQTNIYQVSLGTNPPAAAALTHSFAGSDFWALDLGLDFIHWPQQHAIRSEMSLGRPCRVLQSVTPHPAPGGYSRVLSWVDLETGGVIQAEAYDAQNKPLKKFRLGSFGKVEGQWQLRDMKIRNTQTRRETDLKFDLKTK